MDENRNEAGQPERNTVPVELTTDEALVLYELLSRFSESETLLIEDPSEKIALWSLQCLLEAQLVDPLKPNYLELLDEARGKLRAKLNL